MDSSQKKKKKKKKEYRIPKIQSTELKKVNKLKGPSEDASVPLGREMKAITGDRKRRDLGGRADRPGGERRNMIRYEGRSNRKNRNRQP